MPAFHKRAGLKDQFASLVHASARGDVIARTRHQSFIGSHLLGGGLALIVGAAYVAMNGGPTLLSTAAFAWLLSPIAIALFLSATGRLAMAHLVSAANLAGLIIVVAGLTGGLVSFVMPWMVIVPLEAALSSERRVIYGSLGIACAGMLALAVAGHWGALPVASAVDINPALLGLLGSASALIYAAGLAISVQMIHDQSGDAILRGERRYRLLAEHATDLITRHDIHGEVVFASQAAERVLGAPSADLLEGGLVDRIHPADRAAYREAVAHCLAKPEPVSVEFRLHRDEVVDARERWAEIRLRPIVLTDDDGETDADSALVAVTRDVTASKRQEMELLKARDDAERASRAKTHFLATMSHELRTPLNAIIGFADILTRELFGAIGEERYREYARLIHESGEHLLDVVNEILDMSKIEAGKYSIVAEPVDVAGLMNACCDVMRHGAEQKSIELRCEVAPGLPELIADKRACKQMLLNLLSNAIKFTEEGGIVRALASRSGSKICMQVIDTGIGIAAEDLPNLGAPFVQAESTYARKFEGAGLGLCVVTGLARLHDGTLKMESEPGVGTTVTITLPISQSPRDRSREESPGAVETLGAAVPVA